MVNQNQGVQAGETNKFSGLISKIKGLFHKGEKESINKYRKRTLAVTRKDSIITSLISIVIVIGTVFYGIMVFKDYKSINSMSDNLKQLSSYDTNIDKSILNPYIGDYDADTIIGLSSIYKEISEMLEKNRSFAQSQQSYYESLLQNIYLPSLNVRKNPYTKEFDVTVLGEKYLELDKFQDLRLIQYRSDFIRYVGNDADYNIVERITIGDQTQFQEDLNYFYTPISVDFSSPNKRSFLLLVNKLSVTSTQQNISLLNEFFFQLFNNITENKGEVLEQLEQEYWEIFSSNYDGKLSGELSELTGSIVFEYRDSVIGYDLYRWLNEDGYTTKLIDNDMIVSAIRNTAKCKENEDDKLCFYKFRDKYRDIPNIAYTIGLEKQTDRVLGLKSFIQNLPPILTIEDFSFEKKSSSENSSNEDGKYEGKVTFQAYGRNITEEELDEAATVLGKLCFGKKTDKKISVELALERIDDVISGKGENRDYSGMTSLLELQEGFNGIKEMYDSLPMYNKMIKLFEVWRMMNDANLCEI